MKKPHTGGFLKSPFNMYEGSSIDSGSHKQATEQKGEEREATQVVLKRKSSSPVSRLYSVSGESKSTERGPPRGSVYHPLLFLDTTTQQPGSVWGLSMNNLPTKLQRCTKVQLHHYNIYKTGMKGKAKSYYLVNNPAPHYTYTMGF